MNQTVHDGTDKPLFAELSAFLVFAISKTNRLLPGNLQARW